MSSSHRTHIHNVYLATRSSVPIRSPVPAQSRYPAADERSSGTDQTRYGSMMGSAKMAEKRILLVEDERELRELLALGLRRAGYTVDGAANTAEAQQLLDAQPYALVIADWRLTDGNGIDVADRAAKLRARTIIISGYAFGLPAGAAEHHGVIMKPVTVYDLVAAVQRRIGNPSA